MCVCSLLRCFFNNISLFSLLFSSTDTSYERKLLMFLCLLFFSRFSFDIYWKNIKSFLFLISILFPFFFLSIFSIKQTHASCYFSLYPLSLKLYLFLNMLILKHYFVLVFVTFYWGIVWFLTWKMILFCLNVHNLLLFWLESH